jgi:hypothetical protein
MIAAPAAGERDIQIAGQKLARYLEEKGKIVTGTVTTRSPTDSEGEDNQQCFQEFRLAPQAGLEPTTLRLTAEFQGEAVRSEKRKLLKTGVLPSWSRSPFRMACKKSLYKSPYSASLGGR